MKTIQDAVRQLKPTLEQAGLSHALEGLNDRALAAGIRYAIEHHQGMAVLDDVAGAQSDAEMGRHGDMARNPRVPASPHRSYPRRCQMLTDSIFDHRQPHTTNRHSFECVREILPRVIEPWFFTGRNMP